eukprot:CAMPEP_0114527648 /NCGR_PEP_ID=MMETSP0109-20121206/23742_1 /TAXON_ID=29199 /ORGANISM="Chlorarachnion reptans, Strain CCCM449" /LENGTH=110 /DNA_ID=CAMNT_0001709655 /DNA_START=635 /DNA_END=967 /DNA_ORIENTATION=-
MAESMTCPFPVRLRCNNARRIPRAQVSPPPAKSANVLSGNVGGDPDIVSSHSGILAALPKPCQPRYDEARVTPEEHVWVKTQFLESSRTEGIDQDIRTLYESHENLNSTR